MIKTPQSLGRAAEQPQFSLSRSVLRLGVGSAPTHHGELVQGTFRSQNAAAPEKALVTLPVPHRRSTAYFLPGLEREVTVQPTWCLKAQAAAEQTVRRLRDLGWDLRGGHLQIESPVAPSRGCGSSTSDSVAAIRAVADAAGIAVRSSTVGELCVAAESASDPTMIDDGVVLFAQHQGRVLERLGSTLPPMRLISVNPDAEATVDTLALPSWEHTEDEVTKFGLILAALRRGVRAGDLGLIGKAATASARLHQRFLPQPAFAVIEDLARCCGAAGVQVAHSGTLIGVLIDPLAREAEASSSAVVSGLQGHEFFYEIIDVGV